MRISTKLVIFLMLMNAAAGMMVASGVAEDLNIQPNPGGDTRVNETKQNASQVKAGGGLGSTLFTMYSTVADTLDSIYTLAFYGPEMLENLGVPGFLTDMFNGVLTVIVGADIVYALTGRDI